MPRQSQIRVTEPADERHIEISAKIGMLVEQVKEGAVPSPAASNVLQEIGDLEHRFGRRHSFGVGPVVDCPGLPIEDGHLIAAASFQQVVRRPFMDSRPVGSRAFEHDGNPGEEKPRAKLVRVEISSSLHWEFAARTLVGRCLEQAAVHAIPAPGQEPFNVRRPEQPVGRENRVKHDALQRFDTVVGRHGPLIHTRLGANHRLAPGKRLATLDLLRRSVNQDFASAATRRKAASRLGPEALRQPGSMSF